MRQGALKGDRDALKGDGKALEGDAEGEIKKMKERH